MRAAEIRQSFLGFFQSKGHLVVPSSSLIPQGDPTLLLTSAGMVQMKPYFLGLATPPSPRLASCQKCFRTTDIEKVGNERNLTFFEMLGNFSVGDYFKEGAIEYAWEYSTQHLRLPPERIWVSIYPDDEEAYRLWQQIVGMPAERIVRLEDNWWGPPGDSGPCGPDSELYFDRGPEFGCGRPTCGPGCDCPRFLEYWNLVFMQYYQDEKGVRTPLPRKNVDTGMGLERVTMLLQGGRTVYETDLFQPIIRRAEEITGRRYGASDRGDFSLRVLADHSRGITFLIADGVLPSNEGRGYILRRIVRRAVRHGRLLGLDRPFLSQLCTTVIETMQEAYPELAQRRDYILRVVDFEEGRFQQTLAQGLQLLEEVIARVKAAGQAVIPGSEVFRLYDTFGFPVELTVEVAGEHGLSVDLPGFEAAMARQRERAREAARFGGAMVAAEAYQELATAGVEFIGYDYNRLSHETTVLGLITADGRLVDRASAGDEVEIVLRETPFYPEGGGQVGDTGVIEGPAGRAQVLDTQRPQPTLIVHKARIVEGTLGAGEIVRATVDVQRRWDIMRHHTATHLLHQALRNVLGTHVTQAGSLVAPDRLRFDFTHFAPLTPEQLRAVEAEINDHIRADHHTEVTYTTYQEALAKGAMALFGEKYGDIVRMVTLDGYSRELCGGTHVLSTGQIGLFLITSESSIGAGLRRIEAVCGRVAEEYVRTQLNRLERLASLVQGPNVEERVQALQEEVAALRRELERLQRERLAAEVDRLVQRAVSVDGVRVLAAQVEAPNIERLRELGDILRARLGPSVVALGAIIDQQPRIVVMVSPGVKPPAHELARQLARIVGGGGGGRPEMAQAGGRDPSKLPEALRLVPELVRASVQKATS